MKILTSLDQLTAKFDEATQKQTISDDLFRQSISSWCLSPTIFGTVPTDPLSPDFKAFQLGIYERLTNQKYTVANEETTFNFDHEIQHPYPYSTQSSQTVGESLIGYGWLIKKMNLPPKSRILEIGSGYGALTIHLASMGYQVTCLDIDAPLLDFVKTRTNHLPQQIKTICGDMATVEINGTFDAIIFNASLHHSLEHRSVVQRLDTVLVPNGIVVFMSEPIVESQSNHVPYPWGIRLDGHSVWSICKEGWLELGFQESYFVHMLESTGWKLTRSNLGVSGQTDVWIATKVGSKKLASATKSTFHPYTFDAETEVIKLRKLVEGYEQGRFIRFAKWLKGHR